MKLKEIIIYLVVVGFNIGLALLLNLTIFSGNNGTFVFVVCGTILFSLLVTSVVARRMKYKLDIFAYDIKDAKYLIVNSAFIGCLFTVPVALIISLIL